MPIHRRNYLFWDPLMKIAFNTYYHETPFSLAGLAVNALHLAFTRIAALNRFSNEKLNLLTRLKGFECGA